MKLKLRRTYLGESYTIGKFYINDVYFCDCIEDTVRKDGIKIYGKTAIPYGIYNVIMSYSNKYKKNMPEILDVPNFTGIRIHSGNTEKDSEGCLILGENKIKGMVINSKAKIFEFYPLVNEALQRGERITLEIV